ncbi:MAG: hypothetical protein ACRD7E_04870 [Bryobacteraceae bacterium]
MSSRRLIRLADPPPHRHLILWRDPRLVLPTGLLIDQPVDLPERLMLRYPELRAISSASH